MRSRSLSLGLVIALAAVPVAHADRPPALTRKQAARAATLRQSGLEHYLRREYQLASGDLMEAYRLDKRPETLLGWGEAVRGSGDCELASRIYLRLLAKTTDSKLAAQAEAGLVTCVGQPDGAGSSDADDDRDAVAVLDDAAPSPQEPEPEPEPVAPSTPAPAPRPAAHATSYVLLGSGAVLALGGLLAYTTASNGSDRPDATHAEITSARSRGDWYRLIGASVAATGATVALIGILRYRGENRAAVAPYLGSSGGGVALSGRF